MCGIVGVWSTSNLSATEIKIFDQMLYADVLRGDDSFGVIKVDASKSGSWYKTADFTPQSAPWYCKKYNEFRTGFTRALVGHNRAATAGKVNSTNAHPFTHGHITMVHNGTLRCAIGTFEVDSDWLCKQISTCADDDAVAKMLSTINGAYALVWWNDSNKRLYIARNSERPLHYYYGAGTFYFASEGKMLEWILSRNKIYGVDVKEIPSGKLISSDLTFSGKVEVEIPKSQASVWDDTDYMGYGTNWRYRPPAQTHTTAKEEERTNNVTKMDAKSHVQEAIVEVLDWWETHSSTNRAGEKLFTVQCSVSFFLESYNKKLGLKEGDKVLLFSVPESRLNEVLGDSGGPDSYVYSYVEVGAGKGQIFVIDFKKTGVVRPGITAFGNPLSRSGIPGINQDEVQSVRSINGQIAKMTSFRATESADWSLVIPDNGLDGAVDEPAKVEGAAGPTIGLKICCSRCRAEVLAHKELFHVGSETICDSCYMDTLTLN